MSFSHTFTTEAEALSYYNYLSRNQDEYLVYAPVYQEYTTQDGTKHGYYEVTGLQFNKVSQGVRL